MKKIAQYPIFLLLLACGGKKPVASFEPTSYKVKPNEEINFNNGSTYANSYVWDFGDGTSSTDKQPAKAYSKVGTYNITLTAKGSGGSSQASKTIEVVTPPNGYVRFFVYRVGNQGGTFNVYVDGQHKGWSESDDNEATMDINGIPQCQSGASSFPVELKPGTHTYSIALINPTYPGKWTGSVEIISDHCKAIQLK